MAESRADQCETCVSHREAALRLRAVESRVTAAHAYRNLTFREGRAVVEEQWGLRLGIQVGWVQAARVVCCNPEGSKFLGSAYDSSHGVSWFGNDNGAIHAPM